MPTYHITIRTVAYEVIEVEANNEEDARDRYHDGYGEYFDSEVVDSSIENIKCVSDENDIEHHIQRT